MDSVASTSESVDAQGRTLSLSADGATYTLTIPTNALESPTQITMTAITSIDNLGFSGGLLGAVQLQPDGLTFAQPVSLTVATSKAPTAGSPMAFGFHGTGAEFHLQPSSTQGTTYTIRLMHFSGAGVGGATASDVAAQEQYPPSSPSDQADQQAALPDETPAEQIQAATDYYTQILRPELQDALDDASLAPAALQNTAEWENRIAEENISIALTAQIQEAGQLAYAAHIHYLKDATDQCSSASGQLVYRDSVVFPALTGWFVDLPGVVLFESRLIRDRGMQLWQPQNPGDLDPDEAAALTPCRPTGFKFDTLTYIEADGQGDSIQDTVTGQMCGSDPYKYPWTITGTRTVTSPDGSQSSSFTSTVMLQPDSFVPTAPDKVLVFPQIEIDRNANPPVMRLQEQAATGFSQSGGTWSTPLVEACR